MLKLKFVNALRLCVLCAGVLVGCISAVGCNTVEGAGEDVENLGEAVQDSADD